jgi:hypothetical protein
MVIDDSIDASALKIDAWFRLEILTGNPKTKLATYLRHVAGECRIIRDACVYGSVSAFPSEFSKAV